MAVRKAASPPPHTLRPGPRAGASFPGAFQGQDWLLSRPSPRRCVPVPGCSPATPSHEERGYPSPPHPWRQAIAGAERQGGQDEYLEEKQTLVAMKSKNLPDIFPFRKLGNMYFMTFSSGFALFYSNGQYLYNDINHHKARQPCK